MRLYLTSLILLIFLNSQAQYITSTYQGGNWSNPSTWIGGKVPLSTDSVMISSGSTVVVDVPVNVYSISISANIDSLGKLLLHQDVTTSQNITFLGQKTYPALLILDDIISRHFVVKGSVMMQDSKGHYGVIKLLNGDHILDIQGSFFESSTDTCLQCFSGTLRFSGSGTDTWDLRNRSLLNKVEIGDGVNSKIVQLTYTTATTAFRDSGYLQANNNGSFYVNGFRSLNGASVPGKGISLNILNGGKIYTGGLGINSTYGHATFQYFDYLNHNLNPRQIGSGELIFYSEEMEYLPVGSLGNLTITGSIFFSTLYIHIKGTGERTFTLLGDLTCINRNPLYLQFTQDLYEDPGATIEFRGYNNDTNYIRLDRATKLQFCDYGQIAPPGEEITWKVTGNYKFWMSEDSSYSYIYGAPGCIFNNLIIDANKSLTLHANYNTTDINLSDFTFESRGDLTMGNNSVIDMTGILRSTWIINDRMPDRNIQYTGNGILKLQKISGYIYGSGEKPGVDVTLKSVEITPYKNDFSDGIQLYSTQYNQTQGRFFVKSDPANGAFISTDVLNNITFNDLTIGDGTNFEVTYNSDVHIKGNLSLEGSSTWNSTYYSYAATGSVIFDGTSSQTIGPSNGTGLLQIVRLKFDNRSGISLLRPLQITAGGLLGDSLFLDLSNHTIITTSGNAYVSIGREFSGIPKILNVGDSAFINGKVRIITKSTISFQKPNIVTDFTFPIGKVVNNQIFYAPLSVHNISGQKESKSDDPTDDDYFDAEYFPSKAPQQNSLTSPVRRVSKVEYWTLSEMPQSQMKTNVELFWRNSSRSGITNSGNKTLFVSYLSDTGWVSGGNNNKRGSLAAPISGSVTSIDSFSTFGNFTFGTSKPSTNPLSSTSPIPGFVDDEIQSSSYIRVTISPNPFKNIINLNVASNSMQSVQISILEVTGKEMMNEKRTLLKGNNLISYNTALWSSGTYFVKIQFADNTNKTTKVVKQ